jgi:hypothetical protein
MLQLTVTHSDGDQGHKNEQAAISGAAAGATSSDAGYPGLPWLVLFGRVCSQWVNALIGCVPAELGHQQQPWSASMPVVRLLALDSRHRMAGPLGYVAEWLQFNEGALGAAGYGVQGCLCSWGSCSSGGRQHVKL